MKNKSASAEVVVERAPVAEPAAAAAAAAKPSVPKVCGLDGDCESCQ
jgi:hypothetical protein